MVAGVETGKLRAIIALESIRVELRFPWYWQQWGDLTTERQIGMSVGPIPSSSIERVAEREGLTPYGAFVFKHVMRELDNHHLRRLSREHDDKAAL